MNELTNERRTGRRRGCFWFQFRWFALIAGLGLGPASGGAAESKPLRVALIAGAEPAAVEAGKSLMALKLALEKNAGVSVVLVAPPAGGATMPALAELRTANAAVLYGGSGDLSRGDAAILREFLGAGKGLVVIRAATERWSAWPTFTPDVLGAKRQGAVASGAPMRVINLFPHAIFTGLTKLETSQEMPLYADLASDALMTIEGTVGESTAPLGWLRRWQNARIVHIVPAGPELFRQEGYVRMLANSVLWTVQRPIPDARAYVQRTYLPESYPGTLAVTMPGGPTFAFDPVRGGISHMSDGDFVDLRPRWITKRGEPARLSGEIFYRDTSRGLFWMTADGREPAFHFKGYSVVGRYPELFYRVGDREIREETLPLASGMGIIRKFHVGPGTQPLWYKSDPQPGAEITAKGLEQDGSRMGYTGTGAGEFTIEIRQK